MPLAHEDDLYTAMENAAHLIRQYYVNEKTGDHEPRLRKSIQRFHTQIGPTKQLSDSLKKLGISVSGIHYLCPGWVPVLLNISESDETLYRATVVKFGVNNHLAMVKHPSEFIIEIPDSFFSESSGIDLNGVLKNLREPDDIADILSTITSKTIDPSLYTDWPTYSPDSINIDDILSSCQARLPLVLATSCFLTFHRSTCQRVIIYHHPKLGGVAAVSSESENKTPELKNYFRIFQRLLYLISLVDGYLQAYDNDYPHYFLDETTNAAFQLSVKRYVGDIQRPDDTLLGDNLTLDGHNPISVVKRWGNKRAAHSWRIVVRLAVLNRDAYMFLHADGAVVLSRIEEFLNGWIQGYMSVGDTSVTIQKSNCQVIATLDRPPSVSVDAYVAPDVGAMEARNVNLYSPGKLKVDTGSNMSRWYGSVFPLETEPTEVPAVIYRLSETVGPSIFIGEIAAALSRHYLNCVHCGATIPLSILNLFSGSLSCECTVKTRLRDCSDGGVPVTFLSIDRTPFPLDLQNIPDIRKGVHVVSADVFELSEHMSRSSSPLKEPNDVYASGYDLVIADPPHYLTFDYLCQPITWPRKGSDQGMPAVPMPLYEYLAFLAGKGKLRAFILYFGHKEKEWISLEMHRMLTNRKWRYVWSLLIGDERFVVCFGPRGIGIPECEGLLASAVKDGLNPYTKDRDWFKVAIYDTFYREIKC